MLVVALLLGALAWWYLGRDDDDDDEKRPVLTMGVGPFVGATFVTVDWQFDANNATFQSYQLQFHRKDSPAVISTVDGTFDDVGKTRHTFQGLDAGTAYVFRVTARTDLADATGTVAATTRSPPVLTMEANTNVDTDAVTVNWTFDLKDDTFSGYEFEYLHNGRTTADGVGTDVTQSSYTFDELESNTPYRFTVRANTMTEGAIVGTVQSQTLPSPNPVFHVCSRTQMTVADVAVCLDGLVEPDTPTITLTGATDDSLTFDVWLGLYGDAEPAFDAYIAYADSGGGFTRWSTISNTNTTTTVTIEGLTAGTPYAVLVRKGYYLGGVSMDGWLLKDVQLDDNFTLNAL